MYIMSRVKSYVIAHNFTSSNASSMTKLLNLKFQPSKIVVRNTKYFTGSGGSHYALVACPTLTNDNYLCYFGVNNLTSNDFVTTDINQLPIGWTNIQFDFYYLDASQNKTAYTLDGTLVMHIEFIE